MHRPAATRRATIVAIVLSVSVAVPSCGPTLGGGAVPFNLPPIPVITSDVDRGVAPLTVRFNSDRSTDEGLIVSRRWDFGDGATSEEISPRHTFTTTGDFTVTLTLTDDVGSEASRAAVISVTEAPVAIISVDPTTAEAAPAMINFDGSASFDPDGEIVEFRWDFGDGSREFMQVVSHVYASPGTFRAKLTVTDDKGITASSERLIEIGIPTPAIEIRVPPPHGPLKVRRAHVTATPVSGAEHTLEVVRDDDASGWADTAIGDYLVYDPGSLNVAFRVIRLAADGDRDKISAVSLSGRSVNEVALPVSVFWPLNVVLSVDSPLWIQAVYDVEPGTPHFVRAGIDRDTDECDAQTVMYGLASGEPNAVLTGHEDRVTDVAFAPDGTVVATASDDGTVRTYQRADGAFIRAFTGQGRANAVAFSPDSRRLVWGQSNGDVVLANVDSGIVVRTFVGHGAAVNDLAFSPDGSRILSGSNDRRALLWSVSDGTVLRDLQHTLGINAVAFSPADPTMVATGSEDGTIKLWNATSGAELLTLTGHAAAVNDLAFSADGLALISASDDNTARAWSPFLGVAVTTYSGHTDAVLAVDISPDATRILTGGADGTARVWEAGSAELLRTVQPCVSPIAAVAVSPDGLQFLAGVAARNDIQLDTDPPNGNDLNITYPQGLSLKNVAELELEAVPAGRYYLWAELDSDRTEPVRDYAEAGINVVDPFTSTITTDTPIIPLVNDQASVVVPFTDTPERHIFDLGPLDRDDRLFLAQLSTPGFGDFFIPDRQFSVMVLDGEERILAWYEALPVDPNDVVATTALELEEFVLFTPDTKLIVGHNSLHYYVVVDGGFGVSVRIQRETGLFDPQPQRVYVRFDGTAVNEAVAAGNQPPRTIPSLGEIQFTGNWDLDTLKTVIMTTTRNVYTAFDVQIVSSDTGPPVPPFHTVWIGSSSPDNLLGISDYVDPRNETGTGTAIVYSLEIEGLGFGSENDFGAAIGRVAAHEIGHLLGLRNTDDATDIMQGSDIRQVGDPTMPRTLKAAIVTATEQLITRPSPLERLPAIGIQDAPLLLQETVGLAP